jgi:hypothetical protein
VNLYFSGTPKNDKYQLLENSLNTHRLFSLHGTYERSVLNWIEHPKNGVKANLDKPRPKYLMADSGAFTAWKSGSHTTLPEVISAYTHFIEATKGLFNEVWAINLDVIPGSFGVDPTLEEIKEAIHQSDENYKILVDKFGPRILPVYHQGEPIERALEVEALTEKSSQYVCLSPRNDLHEKLRVTWSQQVHARLKPTTRTHGLATTGNLMLERTPWFSVDSATWVLIPIYGGIVYYWDMGVDPKFSSIAVSNEGGRDRVQGMHFDTYPVLVQDLILKRIEEMGFTLELIKTDPRARSLFSMHNLNLYAEKVRSKKKVYSYQGTLFGV